MSFIWFPVIYCIQYESDILESTHKFLPTANSCFLRIHYRVAAAPARANPVSSRVKIVFVIDAVAANQFHTIAHLAATNNMSRNQVGPIRCFGHLILDYSELGRFDGLLGTEVPLWTRRSLLMQGCGIIKFRCC